MKAMLTIALTALISLPAFADEVEYTCDGDYKAKEPYNALDPSTVSVHAHLEFTMLGDPSGPNDDEYAVVKAKLTMKATNHGNADAGTFSKKGGHAKVNDARDEKYKNHVKYLMGSKPAPAYGDTGNTPDTYVLIPWSEETGSDGDAYVQRQGSGHDAYPTITLKCE